MSAVAKMATPATPYIVGNELVCNMVARALLLPCPPGALLQKNGDVYFCSLDFNTAGQALPPINPSAVVGSLPDLSWGAVLFDILVMNGDRHPQNISHNTATGELTLFDHSHAFMSPNGDIDQRIGNAKGQLMIGGHCLAAELNTWNGFAPWVARIKSIPDYYLEGAVEEGCAVGIPHAKKSTIYDFFRERRDGIEGIVTNNKAAFPKMPAAGP
jgi:hypothetical protein